MLLPLLLSIAAIWVVGVIVTVVHIRRAPVAVEDEQGFHVIEEAQSGKVLDFHQAHARVH